MLRHTLQRLLLVLPVLIGVLLIGFLLMQVVPTDPAQVLMREHGLCHLGSAPPADGLWRGLNHHSQFKCVNVTSGGLSNTYDRRSAELGPANGQLTFNECWVPQNAGSSPPDDGGVAQTRVPPIYIGDSPSPSAIRAATNCASDKVKPAAIWARDHSTRLAPNALRGPKRSTSAPAGICARP